MATRCSNPWNTLFVWGNGDATHCCYSSWGALGNIHRSSLEEIWQGHRAQALRAAMLKGDFAGAGCEPWCRLVRWDKYYSGLENPPAVPEGLGRLDGAAPCQTSARPVIVGLATRWACDLHCTHCLAGRKASGLSEQALEKIWPAATQANILRIMDGEFTINPESLELLNRVSLLERQPLVFMNTHGQTALGRWWPSVRNLQAFHLKFSLEGVGPSYEAVRRAPWPRFVENLDQVWQRFQAQKAEGKDWSLFLNYCVMRSNAQDIPQAVDFAARRNLPLVLNVLHGMRHIDENFGAYSHLALTQDQIERILLGVEACLKEHPSYAHAQDLRQNLDYVLKVMLDTEKVSLPDWLVQRLLEKRLGLGGDRLLGLWARFCWSPRAALLWVARKLRKRLMLLRERSC
jgi:hypothetical protein